MDERCNLSGRQYAVPPAREVCDDGTISLGELRARGARKVDLLSPSELASDQPVAGGYAGIGAPPTVSILNSVQDASVADESLEDAAAEVSLASASNGRQSSANAHQSHELRKTGHIVWGARCGSHAAVRLGTGLLQRCCGEAAGAYPARIRRLKEGRHPVTGEFV